jgi:hypothetical protein
MLIMFLFVVAIVVVVVVVVVKLLPLLLIMMMISIIPRFVFYITLLVVGVMTHSYAFGLTIDTECNM